LATVPYFIVFATSQESARYNLKDSDEEMNSGKEWISQVAMVSH
jgi:hypothetical protein